MMADPALHRGRVHGHRYARVVGQLVFFVNRLLVAHQPEGDQGHDGQNGYNAKDAFHGKYGVNGIIGW
jgi:hypothetical protein